MPTNDAAMSAIRQRAMLLNTEQDTTAADAMTDPRRTLQMQTYEELPPMPITGVELDRERWANFVDTSLREDGLDSIADAVTPDDMQPLLDRMPRYANKIAMGMREAWSDTRADISIEAVQQANDGVGFFTSTLARALGSDAGMIAMGGIEPLARSQQALYGALKGEGWAALSRLYPSVVLENQYDKDGNPIELSPFSAAIDAAWSKMRGDEEAYLEDVQQLREVNQKYAEIELMEFSDVVDNAYGEGSMDQFYSDLYDSGPIGKLAMGTLAAGYAAAEILIDPLLIFDVLPVKAIQGAKKLSSTAAQAAHATKVAKRTRRMSDLADSAEAARMHLNKAHAEYKRTPTEKGAVNLQNATKLYAERLDHLNDLRRPDGAAFDTINMTNPARRRAASIKTTEMGVEGGNITSPRNSWERGLIDDEANGLRLAPLDVRDPGGGLVESFNQHGIIATGEEAVGEANRATRDILEMMSDKLGVRFFPFATDERKILRGAYFNGSRTIAINVAESPHQMLTTFLHETWHHTFRTFFGGAEKVELTRKLIDAGFDVEKYRRKINELGYGFDPDEIFGVVDESTARAVTEMARDPKFWDTMRTLDPDAFEELSKSSATLSALAALHVDILGGKLPSERLAGDAAQWAQYADDVTRGIEKAYAKDPVLKMKHVVRITRKMQDTIEGMTEARAQLQAAGHNKTPKLDKEIQRAERYLIRIEDEGYPALVHEYRYKHESLRRLDTEEVRAVVEADRKIAAARSTHEVQPRPREWYQQDLFEGDMADRVALGPDDGEYAAEGLARMVHGSDADDVAMRLTAMPERQAETGGRIVPGTRLGMIDQDQISRTIWETKQKAKAGQMELWEYDSGVAQLEKAQKAVGKKAVPYDEGWLPKPRKSTEDLVTEGWFDTYQANFFDRVSGGLYPHTWQAKTPSWLRAGVMFAREPMRVLETVDPGKSWPILRSAMHNMENETTRLKSVFHDAMEQFGALDITDPSTLRKAAMTNAKQKEKVNEELSELLFDILDEAPSSDKYAKLTADLTAEQRAAVANIRHELNLVSDRLGVTTTEKFVDGYIHHAFDPSSFSKGGMPPEFAGMSRSGQVFLGALMDRTGDTGHVRDAVGALDLYSRGVGRKLHLEPGLERFRKRAIWHAQRDPRNKFFLKYADMTIAQLRGEPSLLGSLVDTSLGAIAGSAGMKYKPGAASRKLMGMSSLIYSSLLAGNRRYPIMSVATALATTGAQFGMFRTTKALFKSATPEGQLIFKAMGGDDLWARVFEGDLMATFTRDMSKIRLGGPSIQDTEGFIRGMTFWAAIDESLTKLGYKSIQMADEQGMLAEVLFDSLRKTEEVNHFFGVGSKPPIFSRVSKTGSVIATQFLSFPFKQAEQLLAMTADNPGKIFSYMMLSGWISRVAAQELGIDLKDYLGMQAIAVNPANMQSPGVSLLSSAARMMGDMTALMDGHGSAVEAQRSVDDFLKSSEVMVPMLRLGREAAQAAEVTATGRLTQPGRGYGRDVDIQTVRIGGMDVPIPTGRKGDRSEVVGMATGARTVKETMHQAARKRTRRAVNEAAIERLALVEEAKQAATKGDFAEMQKQLERMRRMGFPIGDFSTAIKAQEEIRRLDWYMTEIKKNPGLAHKLIPIMQEYGIIETKKEPSNVPNQ